MNLATPSCGSYHILNIDLSLTRSTCCEVAVKSSTSCCRWVGDRWTRHLRHNAVCPAADQHLVCRSVVQHGLPVAVWWRERYEVLPAKLPHHGSPAVRPSCGKIVLSDCLHLPPVAVLHAFSHQSLHVQAAILMVPKMSRVS